MAENYGVHVRSFNISKEQIAYSRERAQVGNMDHLVEFIEDDYRNISGRCDAFVSIGMIEHVGAPNYRQLGDLINRVLAPAATEPLIQDWEIPWEEAAELIGFCLKEVALDGLPWAAVPIKTPGQPTLCPIRPNELYFNLGCY